MLQYRCLLRPMPGRSCTSGGNFASTAMPLAVSETGPKPSMVTPAAQQSRRGLTREDHKVFAVKNEGQIGAALAAQGPAEETLMTVPDLHRVSNSRTGVYMFGFKGAVIRPMIAPPTTPMAAQSKAFAGVPSRSQSVVQPSEVCAHQVRDRLLGVQIRTSFA